MSIEKIIIHQYPDLDAIASAWIARRKFPNAAIEFLPLNAEGLPYDDPTILIADMGKQFDPVLNNFDHHQNARDLPCAAALVAQVHGEDVSPELLELIHAADVQPNAESDLSNRLGIHALLSGMRSKKISDQALYDYIAPMLDLLQSGYDVRRQAIAEAEAAQTFGYDVKLIINGGVGATREALKLDGILYAVFVNTIEPSIGIMCDTNKCMVQDAIYAIERVDPTLVKDWHIDGRGFYAGRGTKKGTDSFTVSVADAERIARIIGGENEA